VVLLCGGRGSFAGLLLGQKKVLPPASLLIYRSGLPGKRTNSVPIPHTIHTQHPYNSFDRFCFRQVPWADRSPEKIQSMFTAKDGKRHKKGHLKPVGHAVRVWCTIAPAPVLCDVVAS